MTTFWLKREPERPCLTARALAENYVPAQGGVGHPGNAPSVLSSSIVIGSILIGNGSTHLMHQL
eukprot:4429433-Amphidinium_carterae.1